MIYSWAEVTPPPSELVFWEAHTMIYCESTVVFLTVVGMRIMSAGAPTEVKFLLMWNLRRTLPPILPQRREYLAKFCPRAGVHTYGGHSLGGSCGMENPPPPNSEGGIPIKNIPAVLQEKINRSMA